MTCGESSQRHQTLQAIPLSVGKKSTCYSSRPGGGFRRRSDAGSSRSSPRVDMGCKWSAPSQGRSFEDAGTSRMSVTVPACAAHRNPTTRAFNKAILRIARCSSGVNSTLETDQLVVLPGCRNTDTEQQAAVVIRFHLLGGLGADTVHCCLREGWIREPSSNPPPVPAGPGRDRKVFRRHHPARAPQSPCPSCQCSPGGYLGEI